MFSIIRSVVARTGNAMQTSARSFHSTKPRFGLEEFFTNQTPGKTGRSWSSRELRLKSFEDLQKLWFVLLKEKNMLATYKNLCRQNNIVMENPERMSKVKDSMASIKQVVGERNRLYKEYGTYHFYFYFMIQRNVKRNSHTKQHVSMSVRTNNRFKILIDV